MPSVIAQNTLAVYLGGIEPSVRVHLLGAAHVYTLECCVALDTLLHLQLRIGDRTLPALLDSGASDNFIDGAIARDLDHELLPLNHPTKVLAANGQFMDCVSHVSVPVALDSMKFCLCL